jgi:hypothetical protein
VTLDSSARAEFKADDSSIKIPFRFNLDDIFAQTQSTILSSLPPSVISKDEAGGKWSGLRSNELAGQYDITYSIAASVYSKKGLEASATKSVPVLPISQSSPQSPSDTPGEYVFAGPSPSLAKLSLSKGPPFSLEVAGQEPEAIVFDAHDTLSSGSTTIAFVVKAMPRSNKDFDLYTLPKQCQIQARLVCKTLVTPDRIEERFIPYLDQSRFAKTSSQKVQKSNDQELSLSLPLWNHIAPGKRDLNSIPIKRHRLRSIGSEDQFALAKFSFDFHANSDKILPSFFTPLLSRRYAIDITLDFPGSQASQKLSLPVSVIYEADEFDYVKP